MSLPEPIGEAALAFFQKLLGPVGEASEMLSDKIRLYRWKSSLKTLERARKIAAEHNIDVKEVPLKFLIPFLEKASLEEEESPLIETWANLLASAASEPDRVHGAFVDILSSLSGREVALLEERVPLNLVADIEGWICEDAYRHLEPASVLVQLCERDRSVCLEMLAFSMDVALSSRNSGTVDDAVRECIGKYMNGLFKGTLIESVSFWSTELVDPVEIFVLNDAVRKGAISYDILMARGLMSRLEGSRAAGNGSLRMRLLVPTPLALAFVTACRGEGFPVRSTKVR